MASLNSNHNKALDPTEINNCVIESSINISHEDDSESTLSGSDCFISSGDEAIDMNLSEPKKFNKKTFEKYVNDEKAKNCGTENCRNMLFKDETTAKAINKCTLSTENGCAQDMVVSQIAKSIVEDHNYVEISKKSPVKPFECPVCSFRFQRRLNYGKHLITHIGATRFHCNICGSIFISDLQLQHHKLRHTDPSLYFITKQVVFTCNICDLNFSFFSSLAEHYLNHITNMPFVCSLCNLYFSEKLDYLIHQHLHSSELKCNICFLTFLNRKESLKHVLSHQPSKFFRKFYSVLGLNRKDINGESDNNQSIEPVNQFDVSKSSADISNKGVFEMSADKNSLFFKLIDNKISSTLNKGVIDSVPCTNVQNSSDTCRNSFMMNNSSTQPCDLMDVKDRSSEMNRYNSVHSVNKNSVSSNNLSKKAKVNNKYFQVDHKMPSSTSETLKNSNTNYLHPQISSTKSLMSNNSNPSNQIKNMKKKINKHLNESVTSNNHNELLLNNVMTQMRQNNVLNGAVKSASKTSHIISKKKSKKKTKVSNSKTKKESKFNMKSLFKKFKLKKCSIFLHKLPINVCDYHSYQMYKKHLKCNQNRNEVSHEQYEKYLNKIYTKFNDDARLKKLIKYISRVKEMHEKSLIRDKELHFALCEMCKTIYSKYSRKSSFCTEISEKNQDVDVKPSFDLISSNDEIVNSNIILMRNRIQKIKKSLACISYIKNPKNLKHKGPSVVLYKLPPYVYNAYSKQKPIMLSNVLPLIDDLQ